MIYVHPVGGLGNMFFHIASIYALAKDNDDELCLLCIEQKIRGLINDGRINLKHAPIYKYIFDRFPNTDTTTVYQIRHPFVYIPITYKEGHEYHGYFQCEKYFKHRKEEIVYLFRESDDFKERINKYSHLFGNISLHVRRGDYVNTQHAHPLQTVEYYNEALSLLPAHLSVVVFSDDIEWCKNTFIGDRFVFIDEMDYISLYIMKNMSYHIIANSSFSWWGAWMSDWKKVIAPIKWFGKNYETSKDIVPDNWIRI